jgi:cytochrome b
MSSTDRKVLVWDAPTRLFHWLVVALVVVAYATWRLNWLDWHASIGDVLLTLVLFRLLWGFFGSETTRFSRFLASPRAAARHLARVLRREPDHQVGHNPAGGWMALLLLALLLGETLSGLYVANDVADDGPSPS